VAAGLVTAEPKKRPKSSYRRFEADQPNECWQSDFTHWRLTDGTGVEIINWLDDHSRDSHPTRLTRPLIRLAPDLIALAKVADALVVTGDEPLRNMELHPAALTRAALMEPSRAPSARTDRSGSETGRRSRTSMRVRRVTRPHRSIIGT